MLTSKWIRLPLRAAFAGSSIAVLLAVFGVTLVQAQSQAAISQGFETDGSNIAVGSLVSVQQGSGKVSSADSSNQASLIGVTADSPLVSISNNTAQLKVVTSGTTQALVSDINGTVKAGDKIAVSPVRGVGMRLGDGSGYSVGVAQQDFPGSGTESREITAKDASKKTIKVAAVPVLVEVAYFARAGEAGATSFPQQLAQAISGQQVSPVRIAIAFTLAITGLAAAVVIIRSSTSSTMISIGRNPLAENLIRKNFTFVTAIAFGILAVALSVAYLALVI